MHMVGYNMEDPVKVLMFGESVLNAFAYAGSSSRR